MTDLRSRELDPKLRRLALDLDDRRRLLADASRDLIQVAPVEGPDVRDAMTIRALVWLRQDKPPAELRDLAWTPVSGTVFAVTVPLARLQDLADHPAVHCVEGPRRLHAQRSTSVPATGADQLRRGPLPLTGKGVALGIIDFGLDFTLDELRNPDGSSRVAFLWDQSLAPRLGERSPAPFGYGVELSRADLNAALASGNPRERARHVPDARSHGTHVAGIAVGNGRGTEGIAGIAPDATLLFVQPRRGAGGETMTDSVHVAEAVRYVFSKAEELGLPCVINLSLGQNGGSHDGESLVERAIDDLLERPGRALVVAAGNEHCWRGHAGGRIRQSERRHLCWKIGAAAGSGAATGGAEGATRPRAGTGQGDFTPNEMEIWLSSRDRFRVRLISPLRTTTAILEPDRIGRFAFPDGTRAYVDFERFSVLNGATRIYIELSPRRRSETVAPGDWLVELEGVEVRDGSFDAWIERDARRRDNAFADQSVFADADFEPLGTLGTPATTRRAITVANYDHRTLEPSESSGRGPTRTGEPKPEIAAPGCEIASSCAGAGRADPLDPDRILPATTRMSGTSMAAPHVAGIVALLLQERPALTCAQIRALLIASATPVPGSHGHHPAWGYGAVDAAAAAALLRRMI